MIYISYCFNNVLKDISEEESAIRLQPEVNNAKWLAGHLVWGQSGFAQIAPIHLDIPWLDLYNTQLKEPPSHDIVPPSLTAIKEKWNEIAGLIREALENIPDEALDAPMQFPMPAFATLGGLWAFINHHQAYTIGQLGILRRVLGKEAMGYF